VRRGSELRSAGDLCACRSVVLRPVQQRLLQEPSSSPSSLLQDGLLRSVRERMWQGSGLWPRQRLWPCRELLRSVQLVLRQEALPWSAGRAVQQQVRRLLQRLLRSVCELVWLWW
jgi:hypothetical protein